MDGRVLALAILLLVLLFLLWVRLVWLSHRRDLDCVLVMLKVEPDDEETL